MQRKQLQDLARNPIYIPHVYDYCDQCCRECPVSSRCLLHHFEQTDRRKDVAAAGADAPPIGATDFLRVVADATGTAVSELDALLADPSGTPIAPAIGDPLELLGRHYAIQAGAFLRSVSRTMWARSNELSSDALTTIAWFQMMIPTKIYRALVSAHRAAHGTPALLADALATAKLVLICVQRSGAAFERLADDDRDVRIDALTELLDAIRASVERRFPDAATTVRPGLDAAVAGHQPSGARSRPVSP